MKAYIIFTDYLFLEACKIYTLYIYLNIKLVRIIKPTNKFWKTFQRPVHRLSFEKLLFLRPNYISRFNILNARAASVSPSHYYLPHNFAV